MNQPNLKQPRPTERLDIRRDKSRIWSPLRKKWIVETPEETVRQEYLGVLVNEYGFGTDQIDEELEVTGRGVGPRPR